VAPLTPGGERAAYSRGVPEDFLVARNPEPGSSLPYLIRIPLGDNGIVLKAREMWPRASKVYCHRAEAWPADAEIVERVPTRSCTRRGAAIDLVLDRGKEARSQLVLTYVRGREAIFWQTARTSKQARPHVRPPTARAAGHVPEILVDVHERYAWRFSHQQATTTKRPLVAGDYAVELDGEVVAAVERKSLEDLVSTLTSGKLRYVLADLAALPRAAVVVEERYSRIFALERVRPTVVAEGIAECHARFPSVPIVFAETRPLAQEWTYRFFGACLAELERDAGAPARLAGLTGIPMPARAPTIAEIRAWARMNGYAVSDRGRIRPEIVAAYTESREQPTD